MTPKSEHERRAANDVWETQSLSRQARNRGAGAFADLILVDGNPLENIELIANPGKHFDIIMKDGKIYKNTLSQ